MDNLLLTREDLDNMENNPAFVLWLFNDVTEDKFSEEDKEVIMARQFYYDMIVPDEVINSMLYENYNLDMFIDDKKRMELAGIAFNLRIDYIRIKALLMKKRQLKYLNRNLVK